MVKVRGSHRRHVPDLTLDRGQIADTHIHSVRLPSYLLSTEIIFAAAGERLTMRHDAGADPHPYVAGTLLAVRAVGATVGVTRGLDTLLFDAAARSPAAEPTGERAPRQP